MSRQRDTIVRAIALRATMLPLMPCHTRYDVMRDDALARHAIDAAL